MMMLVMMLMVVTMLFVLHDDGDSYADSDILLTNILETSPGLIPVL